MAETLYAREKQLLRQSEAIYRQQISLALSSQETLPPSIAILNEKTILEEQIKQFGRVELTGSNTTAVTDLEPYKIVEYQDVNKDHICFDKSINSSSIVPSYSTNNDFPCTTEVGNVEHITTGLMSPNIIHLTRKPNYSPDFQDNNSEDIINHITNTDMELQRNDCNLQVTDLSQQEDTKDNKDLKRNMIEEQHNSQGHTEQVQQWLDQILLETEIEPTIHEVEKLPDISQTYVCTKLQLET